MIGTKVAVSILAAATLARLLASFALLPANSNGGNVVDQTLGQGTLPALGAALLDPAHTWDHLEEACFWVHHSPDAWTDARGIKGSRGSGVLAGYNAIYTPGTRIVAPPLVVAFLGEALVCPRRPILWAVQQLLLLIADAIGAFCIYHLGKRMFEMESTSSEAEIERHTKLSAKDDGKCNNDLVVPGVLRPERGWIVGLASKIIPPGELLLDVSETKVATGTSADAPQQKEGQTNGVKTKATENGATSPEEKDPILTLDQLPAIAAVSYFCNPVSMMANAGGSTRTLWDTLMLLSLYYATTPPAGTTKEGIPSKIPSATKAALSLAVATYADVGYGIFILPILVWRGFLGDKQKSAARKRGRHGDWRMVLVLFLSCTGGLHFLASLLVGGEPGAYRKVVIQTMLRNVAFVQLDDSGSVSGPSMGLHWYMFVQVFDRFRPYFTVFVSGIPAMFAVPLMIRLHRYPSVVAATLQLLWAIFRPTTTVHTLMLGLHLALINPRTIVRMRNPALVSFFALPVPMLLFVTFHRMWLVTGNGNPNYIFFQCFAYGLFVTIITMEFVSATVKRDKVIRMIEKGNMKKLVKQIEAKGPGKKAEEKEANPSNGNDVKDSGDDLGSKPEPVVVFL
ncbi:hypothetical protein ACHAXT_006667 [Thalassiosira profunda]